MQRVLRTLLARRANRREGKGAITRQRSKVPNSGLTLSVTSCPRNGSMSRKVRNRNQRQAQEGRHPLGSQMKLAYFSDIARGDGGRGAGPEKRPWLYPDPRAVSRLASCEFEGVTSGESAGARGGLANVAASTGLPPTPPLILREPQHERPHSSPFCPKHLGIAIMTSLC